MNKPGYGDAVHPSYEAQTFLTFYVLIGALIFTNVATDVFDAVTLGECFHQIGWLSGKMGLSAIFVVVSIKVDFQLSDRLGYRYY